MIMRSKKLSDAGVAPSGRVTLVGAGPGDPDLLTLKAVKALQAADVILFDALVSDDVLRFARHEAKRLLVGKRGHRRSCRQEDINALMLKLARQGKHVVRLKAGDPMIFGRGGEEIAMLKSHGIELAVVSGVTSASAMAAALGVSLTHRDHAQTLHFVTGHARNGTLPENLDWASLADAKGTIIVYMGGRTCRELAQRLADEGLSSSTPVVAIENISRDDERCCAGKLADLMGSEDRFDSTAPVLIGIGNAFDSCIQERALPLVEAYAAAV